MPTDIPPVEPYLNHLRRRDAQREAAARSARRRAEEALEVLVELLRSEPSVERAYLFGSLVEGGFGPDSDIDVAVEGVPPHRFFALWRELDEAVPDFAVELVDLTAAPRLAARIARVGRVLEP